ncbi:hemicentin-1 [Strongylocentrotus purpuratus]|uniref:Ig-like domain-containing protein n=1 Tax=Strongylocentrotus purpuratus TaxID=7668 RepID=A0A7M7GE66_STRPU|nr:hemicentin-1 [Strongylocentrotus purpuratus]
MTGYIGLYVMTFLLVKFSIQQQITVPTGSSVRLSCACAKSRSLHTSVQSPITWTFTSSSGPICIANWTGVKKDAVSYSSTTKYRMVTKRWLKGDLVISHTSPADQGNYTCEITRRCTVLLDINVPVSEVFITINRGPFLKAGDVVTIAENDRAIFKCYSIGAKPAASITWSLSRIPIRIQVTSVSFSSFTYKGRYDAVSTLIVRRATMLGYNDQPLTCRGSGARASMANSSVWLRIVAPLSPPTITGNTNITLSTTQRSVFLSCSTINSYPLAIIQWSVGGEDHFSTIHHQERFGRFDVTAHLELVVDGSDDGLEIICKVSSPLQTLNKSVTLNVLAPPLGMTVNWTEKPVKEGDSLTVLCTAFGANPKPHVYWETSSHRINDVMRRDGNTATSLLRLSPVTRTDAGLYSCLANNQIASASIIRSFTLRIYYEPNIITTLRTMTIPRYEDTFNITCIAEAIPLPVVEWTSPSYMTNLSRPITEVFGTTIVSLMQIPGDRGNLLPTTFNMTCSASNIIGRTTWTIEIKYGEVSDDVDEDVDPTAPLTVDLPILCDDNPRGIPKMPVERPLLIALISACFVFLLIVLVWHTRRRLKMDEFWVVRREGFYVDMNRRRAGIPGIPTVDELEAVSTTTSPRLTPSSGASIRFEFVSQQSVENTYDAIPVVSAMPSSVQPRRRRIRSDDGYYYDVPPAPRGFDTVRRVQSRRLPTVPTMFIPPETMQAVLRSLSRDTGEMERPTLEHQPGGRSETIIREEVRLFKKSQLRRVLSL